MAVAPKNLIIPGKNSRGAHLGYKDDMRTIEMWANNLKSGGIQEITSTGGTVAVTNPFGPITNLESVATGGGYASLTGPGETTNPGALTQNGDFNVTFGDVTFIAGSGNQFRMSAAIGIEMLDSTGAGRVRCVGGQVFIGTATPGCELSFFGATPVLQLPAIAQPTGGVVVDTQARAAINGILGLLGSSGGYGLTP